MDTEKARELAQRHLRRAASPTEKINAVNKVLEELFFNHNYLVTDPISHQPLRGVYLRDGLIHYHLL